jgi:hypothetical protein
MRNRPFATALLAGAMLCTSAVFGAQATVVSGSSSAFDETVNLTVGVPLSIVSVTSGPLASGVGTAPAPYVFGPMSVASASVGVGARTTFCRRQY